MKLKRCPKCQKPGKIITFQMVKTNLYHNECGNCGWTTKGMPFMWLADITWNRGIKNNE